MLSFDAFLGEGKLELFGLDNVLDNVLDEDDDRRAEAVSSRGGG